MLSDQPKQGVQLQRNLPGIYLDRPRVYMQAVAHPPHVLLLLGLAGSGKTVVAQQYLAQFSCPSFTVELQPNEHHRWEALPRALAEAGLPAAHPQAAVLSIREPMVVLIDRLELGLDETGKPTASTATWLSVLLTHPFLFVVLVSRVFPVSDDLLVLIAGSQAQIINGDALAFTGAEVQTLWQSRHGTALAPQHAQTLVARSGGLAALVALACAAGIPADDTPSLQDMLVGRILDSLPVGLREVLVDIAVLDTLTPMAVEAVSGQRNAVHLLHRLRQHGILTSQVPPQIHPLIRQALLERLRLHGHRLVRATQQAVDVALAAAEYERAWQLAVDGECWECARRVVVAAAATLRQQGASATVAAWIEQLPSQERDQDVLVILAHCHEDNGDLDGALLTLTALESAAIDGHKQQEYRIWLANIYQARGDIVTADRLIQPYLADEGLLPRWRAYVCRIHAIAEALAGRVDEAQRCIEQSIRAATPLHDQTLLARLYQDQATIAGRIGQLGEAEHALRLAERCWRMLDNPPGLAGTLNARAMLKLALRDYAGASALAQQSRVHALAQGRLHAAAIASTTCGDVAFAQEQYAEALLHYQVAADDAAQSGDFATWAYSLAWQAHSARGHGDVGRATELLPRLLAHPAKSVEDAAWLATGIVAAQFTLGDPPSIPDLQRALTAVGPAPGEVRVVLCVMLAQACWQVNQQAEALATWATLEELVQHVPVGAFHRLVPLATAVPALLHAVLQSRFAPFAQASRTRSTAALAHRRAQPMLQIRVLGEEAVWWQGQPVKLPSHGVHLLLFLLTGSSPVAEEEVLRAIWGEHAVAVHALRKLVARLGAIMPRVICRSAGHYAVTLGRSEIDLDLWQMYDLDLQTASTDQLVALATAAGAGRLTTSTAPWAAELRRRVCRRVALMWLEIGRRSEAGDSQAQAYDAFERAQQVDPTSDLVARAVLQQARRAGDRALLIHRYLRYQHALDEELGVEPATDLLNLYLQALEP